MNNQRGFTLIELIITLIILSLVVLSGTYAYQFMADNWERNRGNYEESLAQYQAWQLIYEAIENTAPKMVRDDEGTGFYFLGRDNGFTGYTKTSVQAPEYPAVYRLIIEQSEVNEQGLQLVYEEAVLGQQILTNPEQQLPFNYRIVLYKNAEQLSFRYWGWESYKSRISNDIDISDTFSERQWFSQYDGFERSEHPQRIEISLDGLTWTISVPDITQELTQQVAPDDV